MKLPEHGFHNHLFRDTDSAVFLKATGDVTDSTTQSTVWNNPFRELYLKYYNVYVPPSDSLIQTDLTKLDPDVKATTWSSGWLNQLLGIVNTGVSGYFNSEASKASQTLSPDDIAKVLQGYQQQQQAEQEAAKAQAQTTLIIAGIVVVALAVGAYFLIRKK